MKLQKPIKPSRIEFDDEIQSKLTKTIEDMKKNLWKVPESRNDIEDWAIGRSEDSDWMFESSWNYLNSPGGVALRKTDLKNKQ